MSVMTITYVTESPNTIIRSSRWNTNFTDVTTFMNNNNIDSTDNIKNGGVSTSALANLSVTDAKIAGITTAGKVDGSALTNLSNIPSGAGIIPAVNLTSVMPSGGIIMWSGTIASIPIGWFLCNGSNGTPDLRNRFVVCADADSGGIAKSTISGSAAQSGGSTTITQSNLPNYNLVPSISQMGTTGGGSTSIFASGAGNGGTLTIPSGGSGTAYTQPYYALAYIMKS